MVIDTNVPDGYRRVVVSTSPITGTANILACETCGCLVGNPEIHDEWHKNQTTQRAGIFKQNNIPPQHRRD